MRRLIVLAVAALVSLALHPSPSHAQSEGAPLISFQRVSVGVGGDFTSYRPSLFSGTKAEFRAVVPISYNLGTYSSLTARYTRGLSSRQNEFSAGVVFHLLARGKRL